LAQRRIDGLDGLEGRDGREERVGSLRDMYIR
jgi:hypothetical protein